MNKTRLEAFSDGVIAIIITIMVLEIKIPKSSDWNELINLIPVASSYLLSFIYVGIYWGNHHHLLHSVKRVTSGMIWANLNLLFWLSLIPFVTGWMGVNQFASNTVAVYGVLLFICGGAFTILQKIVERNSHEIAELKLAFRFVTRKGIASVIAYAFAIPLAYLHSTISGTIFVLVAIMWLVPDKHIEKALRQG